MPRGVADKRNRGFQPKNTKWKKRSLATDINNNTDDTNFIENIKKNYTRLPQNLYDLVSDVKTVSYSFDALCGYIWVI